MMWHKPLISGKSWRRSCRVTSIASATRSRSLLSWELIFTQQTLSSGDRSYIVTLSWLDKYSLNPGISVPLETKVMNKKLPPGIIIINRFPFPYSSRNKHCEILVSCSDDKRNCRQAHGTACKLMKLHASYWTCMQATGPACKLM